MSARYLIIHGHFYQPPRKNPWIGSIELQKSAAPFSNWNERINRECYAPNAQARLLNSKGKINKLINNYSYLSFNFGPTLLSWFDKDAPKTAEMLKDADKLSVKRFAGHGSAMAQVYNHIIMPLANNRDKITQIKWGMSDFESRYGRKAEGMWLAETAIDLESARLLSQEGIKFTILAPRQARKVRPLLSYLPNGPQDKTAPWVDVSDSKIDTRRPYRLFWGVGPSDYLDVFFYDGGVSQAVAFEELLRDGQTLLSRIESAFGSELKNKEPRLVNLATDGESYGHHFTFGEMALAWLFNHLSTDNDIDNPITITNYGQYLAKYPPKWEVSIYQNSSWSCIHGVERWRNDCGCHTGGDLGWNQKWRKPLRDGLNWLRDELSDLFENQGSTLLEDPWQARDEYLPLLLNPNDETIRNSFLEKHAKLNITKAQESKALCLLESQAMSMYMFTSCGWFFDDISGLEPVQNLKFALRAISLVSDLVENDLIEIFLEKYISKIKPNVSDYKSGLDIWKKLVLPEKIDFDICAAHWAMASITDTSEVLKPIIIPQLIKKQESKLFGTDLKLLIGKVEIFDPRLALSEERICLALYSGGPHLAVLVGLATDFPTGKEINPTELIGQLGNNLSPSSVLEVWDIFLKYLPQGKRFLISDLLKDSQNIVFNALLSNTFSGLKEHAQNLYNKSQHLLSFVNKDNNSLNWLNKFVLRVVNESELKHSFAPVNFGQNINVSVLKDLIKQQRDLIYDQKEEAMLLQKINKAMQKYFSHLKNSLTPFNLLNGINSFILMVKEQEYNLDFWEVQNTWYDLYYDSEFKNNLDAESLGLFLRIGDLLNFNLTS